MAQIKKGRYSISTVALKAGILDESQPQGKEASTRKWEASAAFAESRDSVRGSQNRETVEMHKQEAASSDTTAHLGNDGHTKLAPGNEMDRPLPPVLDPGWCIARCKGQRGYQAPVLHRAINSCGPVFLCTQGHVAVLLDWRIPAEFTTFDVHV